MSRKSVILFSITALLYVAVRLWRLDASCFWFDEIFSVHAAEHPWNEIWWFVAQDLIHPPLFYAVLKMWIGIGGESLFWLRLLPVLFSALTLVPFIYLCRELKLPNSVELIALAMLAVNGSLIKYTQTLRMYSMLMFLALFSMWLFARYFYRGKSFVPLLLVNLLLIYTHYFGWLVIGSEVIAILIFQRIKWRRMVVMSGILLVSFLPWLIAVWNAAGAGSDVAQNIGWMTRPGRTQLVSFLFDLTEPFYFQASSAEPASIYRISIPILFVLLTALVIYFINWKADGEKQRVYLLILYVTVPAIVAFLASWLSPYSVWGTRHLIVIYAPASILLAYSIVQIPFAWARTAAVTLLLLLSNYALYLQTMRPPPDYVWCEWRNVANTIRTTQPSSESPTKIYAFENLVAYHLWFELRAAEQYQVSIVKGLDVPTDDKSYFLPRGFGAVANIGLEEISGDDLWLAFRTSAKGEDEPIVGAFRKIGYAPCPAATSRYGSTTVFWVKMSKSSNGCQP